MFEEFTEDYFMNQAEEMGESLEVDTREGSVYMDAAMGHVIRTAKFYEDLRTMFKMLAADSCSGEVLDEWAKQKQIYRKSATPSYYTPIFEGVSASELIGDRFMVDGYYFVLVQEGENFYLQSEISGTETNHILSGQPVIPVKNTAELTSATIGEMYAAGTDEEKDEDLRSRWQEALSKPSENWNTQQFKTTCESYDGVGRAFIFPLAYGPCTVKASLVGAEGIAPPQSLINQIQLDMDPEHEGLGQGMVLLGIKFFAEAAAESNINVSLNAVIADGYTSDTMKEDVKNELASYFKDITFNTPDGEQIVVKYMKIIGILANAKSLKDLSNLTVNKSNENITIDSGSIPVLGDLDIVEVASTKE